MASLSLYHSAIMGDQTVAAVIERTIERCCQSFFRYFTVRTDGNMHLVDDLMQQLWLQARLRRDDFRGDNPEPWLWRIAQNLLREHWRKQERSPVSRLQADPKLARSLAVRFDAEDLPEEVLVRQETRNQLLLALTDLPNDAQELLIGFYFNNRSYVDLASSLDISERAVEGRLYRARLALRDKLANLEM